MLQQNSGGGGGRGAENKCKLCSAKFNAVVRKRHCKVCRDAFCASCSNYRVAVPRFGYTKPVRVCANCHMRFLLIRNEIDFTFLFEEKGRRGSESLDSALSPRGSLSGSGTAVLSPRRSVDGADDGHHEDEQGRRGSAEDGSSAQPKRSGSKRLLRAVTKKGSHRDTNEPSSPGSGAASASPLQSSLSSSSSAPSSPSSSSPQAAATTAIDFDLKERDVREAATKLQLPVFFVDRRTVEVVQRKTVVFNAGAPILLAGRPSSSDGLHLKLAEVNIAFWVLGGEMQATNHKRASMRKQRSGKGNKYAVILDGHPISDDRGPDRVELSVVFKNLQLFDWLSFSRAMRELTTLSTIHRAENTSGSPRAQPLLSNQMAPYFVQLLGVCVTDGSNGLQMGFIFEPMTKGSLRNCLIQCHEALNEPELTFDIARHIALAMTQLHDKLGYIHANLSPENVLVADNWSVKVGGFGNAVRPEGIPYAARSSPSPRFHLAPEVLKRGEYSFASDVYSYGMILVELTTLQPPYKQEQFKQLRKITDHAELGEAIESYGLLPAFDQTTEIGALICQCLSVDPKSRPKFTDIVKRLDEIKESCIVEMRYNMNKRASRMPKKPKAHQEEAQQQPTLHVRINEADNTVQEVMTVGSDEPDDDVLKEEGEAEQEKDEAAARKELEQQEEIARQRLEAEAKAKAKAEEEEEERQRKREEEEEKEREKQRQKEMEEEAERDKVRERIRQMIPTRDEGKLATMAKVEQLKGRVLSSGPSSPTSLASSSSSTETEKEERARRVRELAERRRNAKASAPSPPSSAPSSPAIAAVDSTKEREEAASKLAAEEEEERRRKETENAAMALTEEERKRREEAEAEERRKNEEEERKRKETEEAERTRQEEEAEAESARLEEEEKNKEALAAPVAKAEESEEERKKREKDERMLKVKQIEERMKKRSSNYASSPTSSSPASGSPPTSNPASRRSSVRAGAATSSSPIARSGSGSGLSSSSSSTSNQPKPSDDGGAAALGHHDGAGEDEQQGERKRGLSITEAERIARKNMVKAGRERHDSLEGLAYSGGSGGATGEGAAELLGDVGLGLVDEVARMIGELAEHDDDIRRLKLE